MTTRLAWPVLACALATLQACSNGVDTSGLNPVGSVAAAPPATAAPLQPANSASPPVTLAPASPAPAQTEALPPASPERLAAARVQLAPIVGSTVEAVTPLSRRLSQTATTSGLRMVGSSEPGATHILKGYFSAFTEGKETTVVYVWDVLDASGNRIHRIQGQEKAAGVAADGWSAVPAQTMERIADRTMTELAGFIARQPA